MLASTLLSLALAAPAVVLGAPQATTTRAPRPIYNQIPIETELFTPTNYTTVGGIFIQDDPAWDPNGYNAFNDSLGLLDKSANRWENLVRRLNSLNRESDANTAYKLVYIARHGEGYHNVAEAKYTTPLWNCYWSLANGDGNITWGPDATLTDAGVLQAQAARDAFIKEASAGLPLPKVLYSSPLRRAASTLQITWENLLINKGVKPVFKEHLRESIGLHTCDKRVDRGVLASTYPSFVFETPFSYFDKLWDATYQESNGQQPLRLQLFMDEIFATQPASVISITAHSGVINSFFKAINHRPARTQTGGVVPVIVKAVNSPSVTNSAIIGGPSATAPACPAGASLPPPSRF